MSNARRKSGDGWLITQSIFWVSVLTIVPLPGALEWFRPAWALCVLFYWMIMAPHRVGIFFAWGFGILIDVLTGTWLGQHALVFSVAAFLAIKIRGNFQTWNWMHHMVLLALVLTVSWALNCLIFAWGGVSVDLLHSSMFIASSLLVWPFLYIMLNKLGRRI